VVDKIVLTKAPPTPTFVAIKQVVDVMVELVG